MKVDAKIHTRNMVLKQHGTKCVNENTISYECLFEASVFVNLSVWISAHSIPLMPRSVNSWSRC